jgi:hypothetical protein
MLCLRVCRLRVSEVVKAPIQEAEHTVSNLNLCEMERASAGISLLVIAAVTAIRIAPRCLKLPTLGTRVWIARDQVAIPSK